MILVPVAEALRTEEAIFEFSDARIAFVTTAICVRRANKATNVLRVGRENLSKPARLARKGGIYGIAR